MPCSIASSLDLAPSCIAASLIPGAQLEVIPGAAHYSFLAECTAEGRAKVEVCANATAQPLVHRRVISTAIALFDRALGPRSRREMQSTE